MTREWYTMRDETVAPCGAAAPLPAPLREEESGAVRVGDTRVALESVIVAFQNGSSPEEIVLQYPALKLEDVYAVLAYYLRHRALFDAHIEQAEREANELFERLESVYPTAELRQRIRERAQKHLQQHAG